MPNHDLTFESAPSTAKAAVLLSWFGVIACFLGVAFVLFAIGRLDQVYADPGAARLAIGLGAVGNIVCLLLLATGAGSLGQRKAVGQSLIGIGCALVVANQIAGQVVTPSLTLVDDWERLPGSWAMSVWTVLGYLFPILTAALAYSASTREWLMSGPDARRVR